MTDSESLASLGKDIDPKFEVLLRSFYDSYCISTPASQDIEHQKQVFLTLYKEIAHQIASPYHFPIFHQAIRSPFDYYQFGLDFISPFMDPLQSRVFGEENLTRIEEQLHNKHNVILLANHQIEPDPQIISLLIQNKHPKLAADMIFVAGHRVVKDPVAIPMSLGRNLLCIYSKKHINNPPEEKLQKIDHNRRTLTKMQELLNEGGYCIFVAPSGGRDRINEKEVIEIAPFDPQSVELFYLIGRQARHPTHFYSLALNTYHLMPPPRKVEKKLGEKRIIHYTPVYAYFGSEIDMEAIPHHDKKDKKEIREKRAKMIWETVRNHYDHTTISSTTK